MVTTSNERGVAMVRPKKWTPRVIAGMIFLGVFLACGLLVAQETSPSKKDESAKNGDASKVDGSPKSDSTTTKSAKSSKKAEKKSAKKNESQGAAPTVADSKSMEKGTYTVRLRDLEERVNRLKEQIFRSKARLSLLAETVLEKKIAGAQADISFRNEMGGSFRLYKATLLLDGGPIYTQTDDAGSLSKRQKIDLFEGPVSPGDHTLEVVLQYKGHGYGIFSYLKGYTFKIKSSYTFTVNEGKAIHLEVIGFEKGGATTPLEERPAVRYIEEFADFDVLNSDAPQKSTGD